eukprot:10148281-Alexandrium_andersonii.AAC.1
MSLSRTTRMFVSATHADTFVCPNPVARTTRMSASATHANRACVSGSRRATYRSVGACVTQRDEMCASGTGFPGRT